MASTFAGITLILTLIGLVIAILWILVPFLIMGTNKRLDRLIAQNAELIKRLPAA
ncbi:MAG: hypothetical protein ACXWHB_13955 [Usitatibacter sp.]